jgi:hypothetical protein
MDFSLFQKHGGTETPGASLNSGPNEQANISLINAVICNGGSTGLILPFAAQSNAREANVAGGSPPAEGGDHGILKLLP